MALVSLDVHGQTVLEYHPYESSTPTAEDATALVDLDVVVPAVLDQLAGWWLTSASDELTDSLLDAGATLVRHGHLYRMPIVSDDVNLDVDVPDGLELSPLGASAAELAAVSEAAYRHDHPDFDPEHDTEAELAGLLAGTVVGPFNSEASWQLTCDGALVAACVINESKGEPPFGGPWVSELFRLPSTSYRGVGAVLLRKAIAMLATADEQTLGLVVTDGNAAAQAYERLGFIHKSSFRKLQIPHSLNHESSVP